MDKAENMKKPTQMKKQKSAGSRRLSLRNTQITDAGLKHLHSMKSLKQVVLQNTQTSDEAIEQLRQHLPECKILSGVKLTILDFNSDLRYLHLDNGRPVMVVVAKGSGDVAGIFSKLNTRSIFDLKLSKKLEIMTLDVENERAAADVDILDFEGIPYLALFTPDAIQPQLLPDPFTVEQVEKLLRKLPDPAPPDSKSSKELKHFTATYPNMIVDDRALLGSSLRTGLGVGDGKIARIYIRFPDGKKFHLADLSEATAAKYCRETANEHADPKTGIEPPADDGLSHYQLNYQSGTIFRFRDGKLVFAVIEGGLRVSADNVRFRTAASLHPHTLAKYFGEPEKLDLEYESE